MVERPVEFIHRPWTKGIAYIGPIESNTDRAVRMGAMISDIGKVEAGDFRP